MKIRFFYNEDYDSWYLHTTRNFEHFFRIKESEESQALNKSDINEEQLTMLNILYNNGVAPSVIVKAMTDDMKSITGKDGGFLSSTIQSISNQERAAINKLHGINHDWSITQNYIAELDKSFFLLI